MTRKDYVLVAGALKEAAIRRARWTKTGALPAGELAILGEVVLSLSNAFRRDNSNFNDVRFSDAVYTFEEAIQASRTAQAEEWSKEVPFEDAVEIRRVS